MAKTKSKKPPAQKLDPVELLIQYEFVQMITEHFSDLWAEFNGDVGEMLVLGIIGQAQLGALLREKEPMHTTSNGRGISASRISAATSMPRQTVRRKLISLEEKGLIWQDEDYRWRLVIRDDGSVPAQDAFAGLYARGIGRAKRLAATLKPYV
jgi:hypothetical protein